MKMLAHDCSSRRQALVRLACLLPSTFAISAVAQSIGARSSGISTDEKSVHQWMNEWFGFVRTPGRPLKIGRFGDSFYYLIEPVSWTPNEVQAVKYSAITAPVGFVTDLASVPRMFWSMLPTNGDYSYAAVIHDYLYWAQITSRDDADLIFAMCMEDFGITGATRSVLLAAVQEFGAASWESNRVQALAGERRVLRRLPDMATTKWIDWKREPDVFY